MTTKEPRMELAETICFKRLDRMIHSVRSALWATRPGPNNHSRKAHRDVLFRRSPDANLLLEIAEAAWREVAPQEEAAAPEKSRLGDRIMASLWLRQQPIDDLAVRLGVGLQELSAAFSALRSAGLVDSNRLGHLLTIKGRELMNGGKGEPAP